MRLLHSLILAFALAITAPLSVDAQQAEGEQRGLFINLTTDDTWSAAKAIMFAHQRVLANGYDAAIWLNIRAVYLADRNRPSHVHGLMAENGTSIQDMLRAFMADGGTVIMCRACSAAAGLTEADYMEGVQMGNWPLVESWLFREGMQTLTW
jgi:predicted peroxiredoxin